MTIQLYELVGKDDRRFSPYCWRTRMALEHKGIDYETIPVRFTDKDLISFSGQERLPVIRDGETFVSDSWAIAEYLEGKYPESRPLFGGDIGHGLARFLNVWADRVLHAALIRLVIADILDHVDAADRNYFLESRTARFGMTPTEIQTRSEDDIKAFGHAVSTIKAALGEELFLGGDNPAYGDYIIFGAFAWARSISEFSLLNADDPVYNWRNRMLDMFDGISRKSVGYEV
ncbi:MAG: Beta-etherase [Alphaproteobacteria bacterium MarineAlpha11_Bin1]|nr:MAG: Beta-etherase [Alphaproteobacteria bacterium MarineAlpha11_Bin1]|tara:strand:- start:10956 stop:11648 length:693 start_codon:yes stop_codon:yes gene_type:complete